MKRVSRSTRRRGISAFLKMEGRGGMEINSRSLPCRWRLMLCCRAKGEAANGLVTCQSPHEGGIEEKSEHRVLRVSTAIYQQWLGTVLWKRLMPCNVRYSFVCQLSVRS
jgi:hypothetical protein